jgi:hypothetical protein
MEMDTMEASRMLRAAMREAYEMGMFAGEKQMENAELRATIATLNGKLKNLEVENAALYRENKTLRAAEGASYTVNVCGIEATD